MYLSPSCNCCGEPTAYCACGSEPTVLYNYMQVEVPGVDYNFVLHSINDTASYGSFTVKAPFGYPTFGGRILDCRACLITPISGLSHGAYEQGFFSTFDNQCGTMTTSYFRTRVSFNGLGPQPDSLTCVLDIYETGNGNAGAVDTCPGGPIPAPDENGDGAAFVGAIEVATLTLTSDQKNDLCDGDKITFTSPSNSWNPAWDGLSTVSHQLTSDQTGASGSGATCEEDPSWTSGQPSKWRTWVDKVNNANVYYKLASGDLTFQMLTS